MKTRLLIYALLSGIPMCMVHAQSNTSWTCDAPAGHYLTAELGAEAGLLATGVVEFKARRRDERWLSVAAVKFSESPDDIITGELAFYFADPRSSIITVTLRGFKTKERKTIGEIRYSGPIPFAVQIMPDGSVATSLGGKTFTSPGLSFTGKKVSLFCSSAMIEFSSLNAPVQQPISK